MKRAFFVSLMILAAGLAAECLAGGAGHNCDCPTCKPGIFHRHGKLFHKQCPDCGQQCGWFHKCGCLAQHRARRDAEQMGYGGPPAAQVTYPYYTNRGPRDFLDPNPRGIGP